MGQIITLFIVPTILGTMLLLRCTLLKNHNPNADLLIDLLRTVGGADEQ